MMMMVYLHVSIYTYIYAFLDAPLATDFLLICEKILTYLHTQNIKRKNHKEYFQLPTNKCCRARLCNAFSTEKEQKSVPVFYWLYFPWGNTTFLALFSVHPRKSLSDGGIGKVEHSVESGGPWMLHECAPKYEWKWKISYLCSKLFGGHGIKELESVNRDLCCKMFPLFIFFSPHQFILNS